MARSGISTIFRISSAVLSAALAITSAGCSRLANHGGTTKARAEDERTIRQLDADWVKAAAAKDVDAWVSFYANDATVLPPNDKAMKDKASIRKSISELLHLPGLSLSWEPTKVEVAQSGDLAYLYGTYSLSMTDDKGKPVTDFGKNVEIWKKQADGSWRCIVDTWNSDLPANPPV
jgi:uncharacterized protein (TIGR02246 family)